MNLPPSNATRPNATRPNSEKRLAAMKFRAWHRGTREADYIVGCFFDRYHSEWGEAEMAWFEALLDEEDVDIIGWAMNTFAPPTAMAGRQMDALRKLDYVRIS